MKKYKYPEPNNETVFELDYIGLNGNAYFKCGHWCTNNVFDDLIDLDTGIQNFNNNLNNKNMPKLSKPKSFSVSNETIEVNFKGTICECANLLKSGIVNQTIVLLAHADNWHEVNCLNLGADNSDLQAFKSFIEVMKLSLVDLGIISEEIKTDYSLKHQDFVDLEKQFPKHDYYKISKLDEYEKTQGGYSGKFTLRMTLRAIDQQNLSIDGWIMAAKESKAQMLNSSQKSLKTELKEIEEMEEKTLRGKFKEAGSEKIVPERETFDVSANEVLTELEITEGNQLGIPVERIVPTATITDDYIDNRMQHLTDLGLKFDVPSGSFTGFGYFITQTSISDDSNEDWNILIAKITQEKSKKKVVPTVTAEIMPVNDNAPAPVKKPIFNNSSSINKSPFWFFRIPLHQS